MIQFTDYDRITDTILYFSSNVTLSFNVSLSFKDKSGARSFFQYETEYASKYTGTEKARAIKRNMRFFYTIDIKNTFGGSIVLKPQDVFLLNMIIEQKILPMYMGKSKVFGLQNGNLVIKGNYQNVVYSQSEYRYLEFSPIIYTYDNDTYKEGVRMSISGVELVDMDIDRFFGFCQVLKNTDMYAVACNLVNYAKMPPYGIHVYSQFGLGGGTPVPEWEEEEKPKKQEKNSFLDSVKKKES